MIFKRNVLIGHILKRFLITFIVWVILWMVLAAHPHPFLEWIWMSLVPYGYLFFLINLYWLIPLYKTKDKTTRSYIVELVPAIIILAFQFLMISSSLNELSFGSSLLSFAIVTAVSLALAWMVYLQNKDQIRELIYIKKELNKAIAHLQLLRSQINPHFLFNALNTFYGMAIRENAVKTSDGIQRLGDMMRFMLQDNQKDKIPLTNEISYLKNYIYIQQLRLAESENIQLSVDLNEPSHEYFIAPMLLIPFAENAFKHGIRLQERSWIYISLYYKKEVLIFEVYNSSHAKINNDTENTSTGIGLENVKERLKLLYPHKHKLTIYKDGNEYVVKLSLNL